MLSSGGFNFRRGGLRQTGLTERRAVNTADKRFTGVWKVVFDTFRCTVTMDSYYLFLERFEIYIIFHSLD